MILILDWGAFDVANKLYIVVCTVELSEPSNLKLGLDGKGESTVADHPRGHLAGIRHTNESVDPQAPAGDGCPDCSN